MKLKSLRIGRLTTKNNVFVAPMAGLSDFSLRSVCYRLGAGLCFTEMVSAKGLYYGGDGTKELLTTSGDEYIKAVQIFGSDPEIMRRACESRELSEFDIIDINMGCPVRKVFSNGEGSALLGDVRLAEKIVSECVKSGKTITVKMRTGINTGDNTAIELAKAAEAAGAMLVTVHGRSREEGYSGEVHCDVIAEIKSRLKIPVIANGGIFSESDADNLMNATGADGVMLARGALRNPLLVARLVGTTPPKKKEIIKSQLALLLEKYPSSEVARRMRKQLALYLVGARGGKAAKQKIFAAESVEEILSILDSVDFGD